jgi:hypothetical protein
MAPQVQAVVSELQLAGYVRTSAQLADMNGVFATLVRSQSDTRLFLALTCVL